MTPGPRTTLLVEDDPDDVELTMLALERYRLGGRLAVATDGAEALELVISQEATRFAFVMLDLKLPKVSGHEVLKRVRANAPTGTLPVIVLTSSSEREDIIESYHSGANSYIRKPVDSDEFAAAVAQLGLYWAMLNETPD